jgi:hypothetical protein
VLISYPLLAVLLFGVNAGPFNQPLLRSAGYGIFEGGLLCGLLIVATANERKRRRP